MDRTAKISLFLALGVHGCLVFALPLVSPRLPAKNESESSRIEVSLIEAQPIEETLSSPPAPPSAPPSQPQPLVVAKPPTPETPKELPPPEPQPEPKRAPVPVSNPEPVKALVVKEPMVVPREAAFQVAAATNPKVQVVGDGPQSQPATEHGEASTVVKAQPQYRWSPQPEYPAQARRRGQEGLVLLSVLLNTAGVPTDVQIKESSGFSMLDKAALKAVKAWKFEPATVNNKTTLSEVEVPVRFKLAR